MIIPYQWLGASPPARRRAVNPTAAQVEKLEARALLSKGPGYGVGEANLKAVYGERVPADPHPGPIHNVVGDGYAIKMARFYPEYFGQKLSQFNVASSIALAPGDGTLQLNGQVVLPIPTAPTSTPVPVTGKQRHPVPTPPPIVPSYYVFAINRGGAASPGPIPGRPNIRFDSMVAVLVTQDGVLAYVKNLNGNTTPVQLPANDVAINSFTIRVSVPLSLLPATGGATDPSQYSVNFMAWNQNPLLSTTNSHALASMVPEFRNYPVRDAKVVLNPGPVTP
jgi:hypothetical protein